VDYHPGSGLFKESRMRSLAVTVAFCLLLGTVAGQTTPPAKSAQPLKILFLGDKGHHQPELRYKTLQPVLEARGIDLQYFGSADALNPQTLAKFDGLLIYANIEKITPAQEKALLDYVAGGKGLIALHCASYCFLNSPKYVELVGAQFKSHGTGTFRTVPAGVDHPILDGFTDFESWDETYVHTKHNEKDRTVLTFRVDAKGKEPWTWVRTQGKGRVFYTAWGHDDRTWSHPGFQNLVERGIRWAVGDDQTAVPTYFEQPKMTPKRTDLKPFEYVDAKVAYYPPGGKGSGQPLTKMQVALEPDESAKHMVNPEQFELQLYAAEPLIRRPICMNWDERGRLWIAETVDYPNNIQKSGDGHDRIVILEDTKGTGRADKVTVFADKLSIPTSFTFWNGGVVVHQAPQTLFLKSSKGDDVADIRKVLFSGWSTRDTHAGPNNLRYGLDNWLWGIVGYSGFYGTVGGESHKFSQGFYRFKPDGSKLEFARSTNNNSWGVGISEEGLIFGSTANGNPSVYLPIPNRYYEAVRGMSSSVLKGIAGNPKFAPIVPPEKVRQVDFHGRFTAAAGHALYTARLYPRYYWNQTAFVAEPTGHLIATFQIEKKGTDFTSKPSWNLVASDDEWTAPIMAEVGPDGCVWIIDWYNYIVQHNPTPTGFSTGKGGAYETPLRDKTHGRIYRLVPKGAKVPAPLNLKDATADQLVATLKNDNMFWRLHAQRLLVERGKKDVVPALVALVGDPKTDAVGLNPGAIHALWTLHGLGALDGSEPKANLAVIEALKHRSPGVRRNAVLVLPATPHAADAILGSGLLDDPDPHVRLAALLALADMQAHPRAGAAIAEMMLRPENINDRWLPDAITSAAAAHDRFFLKAIAAAKGKHVARSLQIVQVVSEHYARGTTPELDSVLVAFADADAKVAETFVAGVNKGWPSGRKLTLKEETGPALAKLMTNLSAGSQGQLLRLAAAWGNKGLDKYTGDIAKTLVGTLTSEQAADQARINAAKQLVEFKNGDAQVVEQVLEQVTPRASSALAAGLIDAVAPSPAAGAALLKRLDELTPAARAAAFSVLLARADSTRLLLTALDKGKVQLTELTLDQRQGLVAHPDKKIAMQAKAIIERGGGLPSADRQKVIDDLMPLTMKTGDAKLGKEVFLKNCSVCHVFGKDGNKVGPDLTGIGVHPKAELMVHIFDPSRSVEGNYFLYTWTTNDGKVYTGILASESKTAVELIDAEAKKHVLLKENIDTQVKSNKSLMPEGFEKTLKGEEIVNLLQFLTEHGQYVPLGLAKVATAVSTKGMFFDKENETERLIFADWGPKTFKGVPFQLVDPQGDRIPNVILMYGPQGTIPPTMPKSVKLPCNLPAKAIHLLSGVSGWGYPWSKKGTVTLIVRIHYADGKTEDHELLNGEHFADYISRKDVPGSEFAFALRKQQIRYLAVTPKRAEPIATIEFVKGTDQTAPVVMAVTVETR
jgi:putative membrane-bound dehydrogenase-like protein